MSHREAGRAVLLSKTHVIVVWFPRLAPAAISLLQSVLWGKTQKLRNREHLMKEILLKRSMPPLKNSNNPEGVCRGALHLQALIHTEEGN